MSELLGSVFSGSGGFVSRLAAAGEISAGVTGDILVLTPPPGQKVRLTHLAVGLTFEQIDISVLFGGVSVITNGAVNGENPSGNTRFSVGRYGAYPAGATPNGNYLYFTGGTDEVLTINKTPGNTGVAIQYGYEFGE